MRKVAEMCFLSSVDIIHAAAATCSCMWSDPSLPIIRCSVVGSVSVLAISSPGGGFVCSYVECQISGSVRPHILSYLLVCDGVAVEGK